MCVLMYGACTGDLHVCKCIQVQACVGDVRACLLCLANFDGCLKLGVSIFEDCCRLHCLVHAGVRRNDRADRLAVCEAISQSHKSLENRRKAIVSSYPSSESDEHYFALLDSRLYDPATACASHCSTAMAAT